MHSGLPAPASGVPSEWTHVSDESVTAPNIPPQEQGQNESDPCSPGVCKDSLHCLHLKGEGLGSGTAQGSVCKMCIG